MTEPAEDLPSVGGLPPAGSTPPRTGHPEVDAVLAALDDPIEAPPTGAPPTGAPPTGAPPTGAPPTGALLHEHPERLARAHEVLRGLLADPPAGDPQA